MSGVDVRPNIREAAIWAYVNRYGWIYSEGDERLEGTFEPFRLPVTADCSSSIRDLFSWATAPDPNGYHYAPIPDPFTGTLLEGGRGQTLQAARIADVLVFGEGTGVHAAMKVGGTPLDPLLFSHGQPGDPKLLNLSQFGSWQPVRRWRTYDTISTLVPPPPPPGTAASRLPPAARPAGMLPWLVRGRHDPQAFVVWLRQLMNQVPDTGAKLPPHPGGFGRLTEGKVLRVQRHFGMMESGVVDATLWRELGAEEVHVPTAPN